MINPDLITSSSYRDVPVVAFQALASAQVTSAVISFICSSMMTVMIVRGEKSLSTPYRRIIFGVSISDILQSLAYLSGPALVPSNIPESWGMGNNTSCRIQGTLLTITVNIIPMYMCFLCFYYLRKLKYRMTNEEFARRFEMKLHSIVIVISFVMAFSALVADVIHPAFIRSTCGMAVTPVGCRINPSVFGDCDPVIEARVNIAVLLGQILHGLSLIGIIGMMSMLYWHFITFYRIFEPISSQSGIAISDEEESSNEQDVNTIDSIPSTQRRESIHSQSQNNSTHLSRMYRNEIVLEATFYVGAFCFTSLPIIVLYVTVMGGGVPSSFFQVLAMTLSPLCGLFNVLVYTRQQIASLRRRQPELSWLCGFWRVLKAGGESPSHNASNLSSPPAPLRSRQARFDGQSDRNVDQVYVLPTDYASADHQTPPMILSAAPTSSVRALPHCKNQEEDNQSTSVDAKSKSVRRFYHWQPGSNDSNMWQGLRSIGRSLSSRRSSSPHIACTSNIASDNSGGGVTP